MSDSPDSELSARDPDMPDDALGLGLSVAEQKPHIDPKSDDNLAYRVLARKYRPQNFKELIGQDAMVQTLGNAIKRGRLAHAFLMTGVRGVGKTSTARLIAKALNCIGEDGQGGATIDPCGKCEPCQAIAQGRHIDVIEMDAASNTSVNDVREIIDAVRYASVSARYKIYIIDEVHMLSKNAFNALLKTLEEPPPHVKFLFATTEVNKVPITVLSRCQRFDLKRISIQELTDHFTNIVDLEQVKAEREALAMIARSAEGSVRDGLSILDQAIAHADWANDQMDAGGGGTELIVTATQVRDMLGLSDREAIRTLLSVMLKGDVAQVMEAARSQYQLGIEPYAILAGLLSEVHMITLVKLKVLDDPAMAAEVKEMLSEWGDSLSFPQLHRLWQLLLKGHEEIQKAAMPSEACDMALLRIMHASQMPDPSELMELIKGGGPSSAGPSSAGPSSAGPPSASPSSASGSSEQLGAASAKTPKLGSSDNEASSANVSGPDDNIPSRGSVGHDNHAAAVGKLSETVETDNGNFEGQHKAPLDNGHQAPMMEPDQAIEQGQSDLKPFPPTFEALIDSVHEHGLYLLEGDMRDLMRVVSYAPPILEYQLTSAVDGFDRQLKDALKKITGENWTLTETQDAKAQPSQFEQERLNKAAARQEILATPLVKAAFAAFPDARLAEDILKNERSIN